MRRLLFRAVALAIIAYGATAGDRLRAEGEEPEDCDASGCVLFCDANAALEICQAPCDYTCGFPCPLGTLLDCGGS